MLEKVGAEVLAERERIAARVRDELVAAGLPVTAPGLSPVLSQGVEVNVDPFDDDAGGVSVSWRSSPRLENCVLRAARHSLLDDPALAHQQVVLEAMLAAITAILTSAGCTVRDSRNDYAPFTVDVPAGPGGNPSWALRAEEVTVSGRSAGAGGASADGSES
ncbi:hypothetical protein OHU11_01910 [Streptomyces sp. NBC_00257]|uniref:hypothetical protein n=1 Tax=unclassified Streptomyces TaxID=2593676 RepID=UPI00225BB5EF|nr:MULTISPECIES: hypothetical protein [unclassified Streptomyces]WTB59246.1 hypothetical protein OG832_41985 [Streptomyces sp. NBC_00826]WTH87882.1 hypothetical protein OIC43_01740 [Streptomyces sp. NBC_00825]WTH96609.1 hypothetical protein OHA23_01740 [Streptomyces sp. NBC_00822]MCX4870085.1 hypothetical protein [Streptomyces sp. NBC_00906]MCX4901248.1 hypothetical protein [Streptomyces sp. NBC_00892]